MKTKRLISFILKLIVVVSAIAGTVLSAVGGKFMSGKTVFMYFTIQSNIWIMLVCLVGFLLMAAGKEANKCRQILKFVFTVQITLTGFVFCFVLAPTMKLGAWTLSNILTHVIVPVASISDFFLVNAGKSLTFKHSLWTLIPPAYYLGFASLGYVLNWNFGFGNNFPYFFMNWGSNAGAFGFSPELPFMGVFWWILIIAGLFIGVSGLYIGLSKSGKNKNVI